MSQSSEVEQNEHPPQTAISKQVMPKNTLTYQNITLLRACQLVLRWKGPMSPKKYPNLPKPNLT